MTAVDHLLRFQVNGAGVSKCTGVAPGASQPSTNFSTELCCFPYLTGNAVFPSCTGNGLGLYQHVDVEHIVRVKGSSSGVDRDGASTPHASLSVTVVDVEAEGLSGALSKEQV
jgi:hypothetical protein